MLSFRNNETYIQSRIHTKYFQKHSSFRSMSDDWPTNDVRVNYETGYHMKLRNEFICFTLNAYKNTDKRLRQDAKKCWKYQVWQTRFMQNSHVISYVFFGFMWSTKTSKMHANIPHNNPCSYGYIGLFYAIKHYSLISTAFRLYNLLR